jgi:hypothetical protein
MLNYKRIVWGIILGLVFGATCVFLAKKCITSCQLGFWEILYSRFLIGFALGILGGLRISFIVRGALVGFLISIATVIREPGEILLFAGAGAVIGIIIDLILTKVRFIQISK